MRTQVLTRTASVVFNGSGNGTASTGPSITNEVWTVTVASVSASSNNTEATCRIYAGTSVSQGSFIDGTTWGSTGDSTSNFAVPVYSGQQIFAVWSSGDGGATGTLAINGTRTVP
jgi:hypothetical protein